MTLPPDRPTWRCSDSLEAELKLRRARAANACGRDTEAEQLLNELRSSADRTIALRAHIQLARLHHRLHNDKLAVELLVHVAGSHNNHPNKLSYALLLELARAWTSVDRPDRAKATYTRLLQSLESDEDDADTRASRAVTHACALARYRLGQLFMDSDDIEGANTYWRRAFEENSEDISPYAAYALAYRIGSRHLPAERIECMYMYAVRSRHLMLSLRARFELAEFLVQRDQFASARGHLKMICKLGDFTYTKRATKRLAVLDAEADSTQASRQIRDAVGLRRMAGLGIARRLLEPKGLGDSPPRVVIVGAGTGGQYLLEALLKSANPPAVCGFVDDDMRKIPPFQLPMLGSIDNLEGICAREEASEVLMAMPVASGRRQLAVVRACRAAHVPLRNIPPMHELFMGWDKEGSGPTLANQLRPVTIEQTIGDEEVRIDDEAVAWARGLRAFVVGAQGLGAEICRRLAHGMVESLFVLDSNESALEHLVTELYKRDFHYVTPIHSDWLDVTLLKREMAMHRPSVVFHTAGLSTDVTLERNPFPGARRDVLGARAVAKAAGSTRVPYMLYVSDTRAADPSNTFGAVKALSEEAVLAMEDKYLQTAYAVVRTTPPMGSPGSILARIASQIDAGGPVTIPGDRATARFLSTARAAELILHVARMMGEQGLKARLALNAGVTEDIGEIAREMIRLRGCTPETDINVIVESQHPSTAPIELRGEPLQGQGAILRLHRESLDSRVVEELIDRLAALPDHADETGTLPVLTRDFALTVRDYLRDLSLGARS